MPKAKPTTSQPRVRTTRQQTCNRAQPSRDTTQEEGENFSLDVADGNDDDNNEDNDDDDNSDTKIDHRPPHRSHARPTAPVPQRVNDPNVMSIQSNKALDIDYFFDKTSPTKVCVECRYVVALSSVFPSILTRCVL